MNTLLIQLGGITTREISVLIWLSVLFIWLLKKNETRNALYSLLKTSIQPSRITLWISLLTYISSIVLLLYEFHFWDKTLLKDTIVWSIFSITLIFRTINSRDKDRWANDYIGRNITLLVIVEYVVSSHTLNLFYEILLTPMTFYLGMMLAYSETKNEYKQVNRIINSILIGFGILLILRSTYYIITNFTEFATADNLRRLSIPPILTVLFFPYLWCLYIYSSYQRSSAIIQVMIKDTELQKYAKRNAVTHFKSNTNLLRRWQWLIATKKPNTKHDIDKTIESIKEIQYIENHPPRIPKEAGWFHSEARKFLSEYKFHMNDYNNYYEDEWGASSDLLAVNNEIIPDCVGYYIDGNKFSATKLKLVLDVQDKENADNSEDTFMSMCDTLLKKAIGTTLTENMTNSISSHTNYDETIQFYKIAIAFERFISDNGYTIKFVISILAD